MDSQLINSAKIFCSACFNSERKLNLINDHEIKQTYISFLDDFKDTNNSILLCFECLGRIKSTVRFRKQVRDAYQLLTKFSNHNTQPTSLSILARTKTETFKWQPCKTPYTKIANSYKEEYITKEDSESYNTFSDNENTEEIECDNLNIEVNSSKRNSQSYVKNECLSTDNELQCDSLNKSVNSKRTNSLSSDDDKYLSNDNDSHHKDSCVKVENFIEKTECIEIKLERIDDDNDVIVNPVTNCEFNDSDDEPLKKAHKKKVKNEAKTKVPKPHLASEGTMACAYLGETQAQQREVYGSERKKTFTAKVPKGERPSGVVSGVWVQKKLQQLNIPPGQLEMVVLSWEEVEQERQKALNSEKYTRHEFRCPSCIIGFNHRFKLESHMKKHLPESGDLECSVCLSRFKSQSGLLCHRRRHRSRWRCCECGHVLSRASVAADHVSRAHGAAPASHACRVCDHRACSLGKLRVHMKTHAERQHCEQCGKTFRDKSSLKTHLYIHTNQKDFSCEVCNKKFRFKKALEIHSISHQASELLYCADCDMNFKNRLSFYQHINYSMKHIHPDKIKYACEFCPRRFSKPARLEEHRLSIHLKLAPHRCTVDGCSFASASRPALRTHIRMVHRNKRLERNHVCHTCGKAYTTKKILEGHIRSHTGERPFVCSKCPATFSHDAALYNHNKLVHKTPFVRRRKQNAPLTEEPLSWNINSVADTAPRITNEAVSQALSNS